MRLAFYSMILLFNLIVDPVSAYGVRGAAERVLYYYAYLAEEIAAPGGFTVAPGCGDDGGTRIIGTNTKRCTINEFLRYIWKATPSTGDTVRPEVSIGAFKGNGFKFEDKTIEYLVQVINSHVTPEKFGLTGNADAGRILAGATDFYDALKKIGKPIQDAATELQRAQDKSTDDFLRNNKIISQARNAATGVVELRQADQDLYRVTGLSKRTSMRGVALQVKPAPNTQNLLSQSSTVLDRSGTVNANKKFPDIMGRLRIADRSWESDPSNDNMNGKHRKALNAAKDAMRACGG